MRRTGLACGCVSLSGAGQAGHLFAAGDNRFRNGYIAGRALNRASTTNSANETIKRKSTWDTSQITVSQNNLYNLTLNTPSTVAAGQHMNKISTPIATPISNHSPPENSNKKLSPTRFPMTHQPCHVRVEEQQAEVKTKDTDEYGIATTSFMTVKKGEADIISGIECDCKASIVRKITQQNNNYD
jgi:hypothetical protein